MIDQPLADANLEAQPVAGQKARAGALAWLWALAGAVALAGLIFAIHRLYPRTLVSFHGFVHLAIAGEFLKAGPARFPPENPFFAGQPLPYYWFFQFLGAQVARLLGTNPLYGMEALILASAAGLVLTGVALGKSLFRSARLGGLIAFLVLAGANPLGFIIAGIKIARGGLQVLQDDPNFLWGVVHPLYSLIRFKDHGGLYGPLLNFFLNLTSRPLALASLLLAVLALKGALDRPKLARLAALAGAFALTAAFSPIIAIPAAAALMGGLGLVWLLDRPAVRRRWPAFLSRLAPSGSRLSLGSILISAVAMLAGLALAAPTFLHLVLGPSKSQVYWILFSRQGLEQILVLAITGLPLVLLAWVGLKKSDRISHPLLPALFFAALALLALNAPLWIPPGNETNFFHAAVIFLAVPAAAAALRSADRLRAQVDGRIYTGLVLAGLPTTLLLLAAYLARPALPLESQGANLARLPAQESLNLVYEWARTETSQDAVFVLDPKNRVTMAGNTAEFPTLAGRALFTEARQHYLVEPYPDAGYRVNLSSRLLMGEALSQADQAYLSALGRPVYLLADETTAAPAAQLEKLYGTPVFSVDGLKVFRLHE